MSSPACSQLTGSPVVTLTTTTETAAIVSNPLPVNAPAAQGVRVSGTVTGATGAGVTSCQVRVYRGTSAAGTQVGGTMQEAQGASSFYSMAFEALDPSPGADPQYTATVQQVGATGNGTVTFVLISAEIANLSGQ